MWFLATAALVRCALRIASMSTLLAASLLIPSAPAAAAVNWTTHGPYGGIADEIVVDPKTPTTLYEASRGGGVFKSLNRGDSWKRASTGLADPLVYTLVVDPTNTSILYAAGGNGVFRSTDGAASWTQASFLVNVHQLAIDPKTPTTLYAVVSQGSLYKSTNSGGTWTSQFNQLPSQSLYCIVVDPVTPTNVYVGAQGGVWRTTNGGAKWTLVTNGLGSGTIFVETLAINPVTPRILYAGTADGLKQSVNAGVSWTAVSAAPSGLTLRAVDPSKPNKLYGTVNQNRIFASTDSGATWDERKTVATGFAGSIRALTVDPTATAQIYAGTDHGVFSSDSYATSWTEANVGLANTLVTSLALDPKTPTTLYAGTEYGGIFKTADGGGVWTRVYDDWNDKITSVLVDSTTPSTLYASSSFGNGVFKSVDSGDTWTNPLASTIVLALAIDRKTSTTLYAGTGGGSSTVLKSVDTGSTWVSSANGLPAAGSLQAGSLSALNGRVVLIDPVNGAYVSTNAGAKWTADNPPASGSAKAGAARPSSAPYPGLDAGFVVGLAFTTYLGLDKAANFLGFDKTSGPAGAGTVAPATGWTGWAQPTGVDPSTCPPLAAVIANDATPSTFYAGGLCGVLKGTSYGARLVAFGGSLPANTQVDALALTPDGKTVYAGIYGGGVYSLTP